MKTTLALSIAVVLLFTGCGAANVEIFDESYPTQRQDEYVKKLADLGEPLDLPLPLEGLVEMPKGKGNAAEFYSEAFKIYERERDNAGFIPVQSTAVDKAMSGAEIEKCEFVPAFMLPADKPENVMAVTPPYIIASAMIGRADEAENQGDLAKAEDIYKRIIIFGRHLESERASLNQVMIGFQIEALGAKELFAFYKARNMEDKAAPAEKLLLAVLDKYGMTRQKLHLLSNVKKFAALKACIYTIENDPNPIWRKEACSVLAVLRVCGFRGPKDKDDRYIAPIQLFNPEMQALASLNLKKARLTDKDETVKAWADWCMQHVEADTIRQVESVFQPVAPEQ